MACVGLFIIDPYERGNILFSGKHKLKLAYADIIFELINRAKILLAGFLSECKH